jgi:hypothetical protein
MAVCLEKPGGPWKRLALLAALFTVLNAVKPLQVDDAAYCYYAAHIAEHPLDPYGFEIHWYQWPSPANEVLAPPVLPYWWAAAIRLFGDRPFLWKLWLFPFNLLFVLSLHALFRRFARGLELPLVAMTVLSPTFLPSLNLMLDVPALALALCALSLFFEACDRLNPWLAVGAGLVAGLAMETKYTAFLAPAAMVLYSGIFGLGSLLLYSGVFGLVTPNRPWFKALATLTLGLLAAAAAGMVFVSWEALVARRYGESHFLREYRATSDRDWLDQLDWALPLVALLGGVHAAGGLLGLTALRCRLWAVVLASVLVVAGFGLVACIGATIQVSVTDSLLPVVVRGTEGTISLEQVIFTSLGLLVIGTLGAVGWRLLRGSKGGLWRPRSWFRHRQEWFLVLWLALEAAGYFAMTPFGAVRRIMGVVVVGTLLAGRLASRTCRAPKRAALVRSVAAGAMIGGLVFYGVDLREAWASKLAVSDAAAFIRQQDPDPKIWFVGHWGFQFYGERAGMRAVAPDLRSSLLIAGDWLVVPDDHIQQQRVRLEPGCLELVTERVFEDAIPLRTVQCFYGTGTGVPLQHKNGPRLSVRIYRVIRDFVPATPG